MAAQLPLPDFIDAISKSIADNDFVKLSLGNSTGGITDLKNILIRRVAIRHTDMLSFTYRYKTKDIIKNFELHEAIAIIQGHLTGDFRIATLFLTTAEVQFEILKNGKAVLRNKVLEKVLATDRSHDKQKHRVITASGGKHYLAALGITDAGGTVFKHAQDKYKQINHYISILEPLIKGLPEGAIKQVADMGAGKGYLTFALYDFLHNQLKMNVEVTGVEFRPDLVKLCNEIAVESGFTGLKFVEGTIENYDAVDIDMLIALHACDTATDDAIFRGITANAQLIVVAPCCHKQIRRQIEAGKAKNDVSFLTRHGIFMERQAEMVTDGIRALLMEYAGYKTKVFEFISDAHTPKNVLITGVRHKAALKQKELALQKITAARHFFGIGYHHLQRLMKLE